MFMLFFLCHFFLAFLRVSTSFYFTLFCFFYSVCPKLPIPPYPSPLQCLYRRGAYALQASLCASPPPFPPLVRSASSPCFNCARKLRYKTITILWKGWGKGRKGNVHCAAPPCIQSSFKFFFFFLEKESFVLMPPHSSVCIFFVICCLLLILLLMH